MKIKFSNEHMKLMSIFESITKTKLKDCFFDGKGVIYFVVEEGELGKAIGKQGINVRNLKKIINRKIKIVEFNSQLDKFIRNVVLPLKIKNVIIKDKVITLVGDNFTTRGLLIGRNGQNLREYEKIVKRYFDIDEIRVI